MRERSQRELASSLCWQLPPVPGLRRGPRTHPGAGASFLLKRKLLVLSGRPAHAAPAFSPCRSRLAAPVFRLREGHGEALMRISGRAGRPRGCAPPASVAPHARPLRWGPGVGESTFGGGGRRQRVHVRGLPALHHRLAQDLQVRVRGIVGRRRRPPRGAAVLAGREDGGRGGGAHAAGWTARPGISFQRAGLVPAAPSGPGAWPAGGVAGRPGPGPPRAPRYERPLAAAAQKAAARGPADPPAPPARRAASARTAEPALQQRALRGPGLASSRSCLTFLICHRRRKAPSLLCLGGSNDFSRLFRKYLMFFKSFNLRRCCGGF